MSTTKTFLAPAKINLFLHIIGRRGDGYHELQSAFLLLDFYDKLHLTPNTNGTISRINDIANVPAEQDLCIKAALALKKVTGCTHGVDIQIEKNIPMGGGLGGGSSDAATVLLALNQLWSLNLNRQTLMDIGLRLGADVPVFIFGQTAWAEGIGEVLSPISLSNADAHQHYVVLSPKVNVSTAHIFNHSGLTRDTKPLKIADFSNPAKKNCFKNDLEALVCKEFTAVAETLAWLNQFGKAKMSGSGASAFVAVDSKLSAEKILQKKPLNCFGFIAKGLKYHPHFDLTY